MRSLRRQSAQVGKPAHAAASPLRFVKKSTLLPQAESKKMLDQKSSLFRKESIERLSSPERLDQLMQVVNPKSWLPLVALGSLVGAAIIWSIYGRIPITVEGRYK